MKLFNLFFLSVLCLCGCSKSEQRIILKDFPSEKSIVWEQVFDVNDNEYCVYFYSPICAHCNEIKDLVLTYYSSHQTNFYFLNTLEGAEFNYNASLIIGADNIADFYITGTPFLGIFIDHKFADYYEGTKSISNYLKK